MRTRHSKRPLPLVWSKHPAAKGLVLERDIAVSPRSRLRAKLLVFNGVRSMRKFWRVAMNESIHNAAGVVRDVRIDCEQHSKDGKVRKWTEVDERYFAIVALAKGKLHCEIVCHESVHAGFSYSQRLRRSGLWPHDHDNMEEKVCYPTGRIMAAINEALWTSGLHKS
jgi:hypothetical protein